MDIPNPPEPRIIALPVSPAELVDGPRRLGLDFIFSERFRVWPAGYFCDHVDLDAVNEAQARVWGAIELGVSADKVRVQRVARCALEGERRA